jgi:excisionase family DNA binding protein
MEKLFSISEAADYLRVSHWTVRRMLKTRQLGRTKVGSRTLIRESQLQLVMKDEFSSFVGETNSKDAKQNHPSESEHMALGPEWSPGAEMNKNE